MLKIQENRLTCRLYSVNSLTEGKLTISNREVTKMNKERHMMQIRGTLWEALVVKAAKESLRLKKAITPAKYAQMVLEMHVKKVLK